MARFISTLALIVLLSLIHVASATAASDATDLEARTVTQVGVEEIMMPHRRSRRSKSKHSSSSSNALLESLRAQGIHGFAGQQGPGIGSWFRTDASQDATNGHSWCGYPYNDNSNGFAPDISVMMGNFGDDYEKAATAYCGLEAIVTTPNGKSKTMYIIDAFDHRWVRSPGSVDITKNQFASLYRGTDDKNVVIKGITWKLTGRRSKQYSFKGPGN